MHSMLPWPLEDQTRLQRIREDVEGAVRSGVRSTPAFFVNGAFQDVSFGLDKLVAKADAEVFSANPTNLSKRNV